MTAIDGASDTPPNTITSTNHDDAGGAKWLGFRPSGLVRAGGAGNDIVFDLCDARNLATPGINAGEASLRGRKVTVSGTGRAFVVRCTCASLTVCTE